MSDRPEIKARGFGKRDDFLRGEPKIKLLTFGSQYQLGLPIRVEVGLIGKIILKIPWSGLFSQPIILCIEVRQSRISKPSGGSNTINMQCLCSCAQGCVHCGCACCLRRIQRRSTKETNESRKEEDIGRLEGRRSVPNRWLKNLADCAPLIERSMYYLTSVIAFRIVQQSTGICDKELSNHYK